MIVPKVPLAKRLVSRVEAVVEMAIKKNSIGADILVEADIGKTVGKK